MATGEIKAGITLMAEFETGNKGKAFKGFNDYMDRPEAVKNKFAEKEKEENYHKFNEYMGNPEKSEGLFTTNRDNLTEIQKEELNNLFDEAQSKGSIMEKLIFSFDPRWLEKHNIVNDGAVNVPALMDYTRKSVNTLKSAEKGLENFIWTASIHHNTDNLHIHVAMVELNPSWTEGSGRCRQNSKGELYQRGKIKESNLEKCKSTFANEVIGARKYNENITDIVRNRMIGNLKNKGLYDMSDKKMRKALQDIKEKLPENRGLWKYNMNAMSEVRPYIDNLTDLIIKKHFKNEYEELLENIDYLDASYKESYGKSSFSFKDNKLDEIHQRLGNTILSELKKINYTDMDLEAKNGDMRKENIFMSKTAYFAIKRIEKAFKKDFEHMKNQYIYEKTQMEKIR